MGYLTTRQASATFAELICADPEWLRAEFDALIAAGFGAPPAWPRPPARPWVPSGGDLRARQSGPPKRFAVLAARVSAALRAHRRQRSPP